MMDQVAARSLDNFTQENAVASSLEFALLASLIGVVCLLAMLAVCKHT